MATLSLKKIKDLSEKAIRAYQKYEATINAAKPSKRSISYWRNRLYEYEEQLRITTNRRLSTLLKDGLVEKTGMLDKTLARINEQIAEREFQGKSVSGKLHFYAPTSALDAYENILAETSFLNKPYLQSRKAVDKFIEEKIIPHVDLETYSSIKPMSKQDFIDFWKFRQYNPVQEFLNIYPPSPPEIRGSVGTMVVDLWNSEKIGKSVLKDYFGQYEEYLKAQEEGRKKVGLSTLDLIRALDKEYAKIGKHRSF